MGLAMKKLYCTQNVLPAYIMYMRRTLPIIALVFFISSCKPDHEKKFDKESGQEEVLTKESIDAVVDGFETISFSELNEKYKSYTDPQKKFRSALANKTYHIVRGDDIYKYVVGKYRVKNFLTMDDYYNDNQD